MNEFRNLMCVKSIITILLVLAVVCLAFIFPEQYSETMRNCCTMVVTFYFSHQQNKLERSEQNDRDRRIETQRAN